MSARHALRHRTVAGGALLGAGDDGAAEETRGEPRRIRFARLARVSVRHDFYNASGGVCRAFVVRPTGFTAALLRRLGMLFRAEPDGFSVLYDVRTEPQLLGYLRGQVGEHGAWTRMTFLLSLENPYLVGFSDLPPGTNAARENFYLTNREAHEAEGLVLLAPGERVTGAELLSVTGSQVVQPVDPRVARVDVRALSGEVVRSEPRCHPPLRPGGPERCSDVLYFDLSTLPEDWYAVERVGTDGAPILPDAHYLYTSLYPMPLCMVDLLFSSPDGGEGGVYPVTLAGRGGDVDAVAGVHYTLRFTRRSTWWSYYVLPQTPGGELYDLGIEAVDGLGEPGAPRVRFLGPCEVRLPGGERAWRFLSAERLPLEERSTLHLRLTGRTGRMTDTGVLVERLPVASATQVLPMRAGVAWARARDSLADPDPAAPCRALLRRLRDPGPGPEPECYSDIFVYV